MSLASTHLTILSKHSISGLVRFYGPYIIKKSHDFQVFSIRQTKLDQGVQYLYESFGGGGGLFL